MYPIILFYLLLSFLFCTCFVVRCTYVDNGTSLIRSIPVAMCSIELLFTAEKCIMMVMYNVYTTACMYVMFCVHRTTNATKPCELRTFQLLLGRVINDTHFLRSPSSVQRCCWFLRNFWLLIYVYSVLVCVHCSTVLCSSLSLQDVYYILLYMYMY